MGTRSSVAYVVAVLGLVSCLAAAPAVGAAPPAAQKAMATNARILFLHHSTGECVWGGGVAPWFETYNAAHRTRYTIKEQAFPKDSPYGWENYPYDYWNIWVQHAGAKPFKQEPTLEMLTPKYDVIVFKHCFPVSQIEADTGQPDVASSEKRLENYKLQYAALKEKMRKFPKTRFVVWTGAALLAGETDEAAAKRAKAFFEWVRNTWEEKGDNIYVWDFHHLETEGGLYLKAAFASGDSHPNEQFSRKVAPLLCQRIVDVIEGRGDVGHITGKSDKPQPPVTPPTTPEPTAPTPEPTAPTPEPTAPTPEPTAPTPEPTAPTPEPTTPSPAVKVPPTGPGKWLFDNAEDSAARRRLWTGPATYTKDAADNVIRLNFAAGEEEDWGEYGRQRLVYTRPPATNHDVRPYRYLALRAKADRDMELVLTLLTLPDPRGPIHQPHFGFTAYLRLGVGDWKWLAVDLTKLELGAEGADAYEKAGKPTRIQHLTLLRFCTNKKNEKAAVLVDDITFLRDLPPALKGALQQP